MNHKAITKKAAAVLAACSLVLALTACGSKPASAPAPEAAAPSMAPQEYLPPEVAVEPVEEHTVVGTVVDATMNQLMLLLEDGRELSFPTVDTDIQLKDGLLEGMMIAVTYRGAEITGSDTTGVHVDYITDAKPEVETAVQSVVSNITACDDIVYTTTRVHVRAENNINAKILETANKGAEFHRTGTGTYGWSRVDFNGGEGYIFGDYLVKERPTVAAVSSAADSAMTDTDELVYTTVRLRMHEVIGLDGNVLGVVPVGTALRRLGTFAQGWSQVEYNGGIAFCDSEYLSTTAPSSAAKNDAPPAGEVDRISADNAVFKTTVALRMHVTYSTDSTVVEVLPKGTPVTVISWMDNHWAEVSYNGKTVYCVTQYLAE